LPFESSFSYNISFGCEGAPIQKLYNSIDKKEYNLAQERFFNNRNDPQADSQFVKRVMGIKDNELIIPNE
jgi:hypothetical protein